MALFRSERGIGRGEVAESRLEVPLFALFMLVCMGLLFVQHLYLGNLSITLAFAISIVVFGVTITRVDFGVYILVIAMLLSPEIEAGKTFSGERMLNLRYDDVLILVIFLGVMAKLAFEGRLTPWQPSPINAGIMAYYGVCILATLLALERNLGAWDRRTAFFIMLKMLEFYLVFFLVGHAVRDLREVRRQLTLFFIVTLVVSTYAIYTIKTEPRVSAPFETGGTEPNTLGGYLVVCMCVAMGLFTQAKTPRHKVLFLLLTAIPFIPMLYTLSRASYVAFVVGASIIGFVSRRFVILLAVGLLLGSSAFIMPKKVVERVVYTFQEDSGTAVAGIKVDKSTHERFLVWRKVKFIVSIGGIFPWLGGGVSWENVLDSQYARVILETGLLGLATFWFLQFTLLRTAREAYRWTDDWVGRGLSMGIFAATFALIAHSIGTISFLIVRIMEPYWFLIAMAVTVRSQAIAAHRTRIEASAQPAPQARLGRQADGVAGYKKGPVGGYVQEGPA